MIVPNWIVQHEGLVSLAPGIAGPIIFLQDDRRHPKSLHPRAKRDASLAASDNYAIGLPGEAERRFLLALPFQPVLLLLVSPMLYALDSHRTLLFLVALQLHHGGKKRP